MKQYKLTSNLNEEPGGQSKGNDKVPRCDKNSEELNIYVNEEITSNNQLWDGTETEFIADDEAEEFDEQFTGTGIKFDYVLKYQEILDCFKECSLNNKAKGRNIYLTLLAFGTCIFLISFFISKNMVCICITILLLLALGIEELLPKISLRKRAKQMVNRDPIYVEVYPDNIVVGNKKKEYEIALDGSSKFKEFENMFLIFPPNDSILIIPIRAIEPDFLADVHAMLVAGTTPKSSKD